MSRIFISYSSTERHEALSVQQWLEDNGWDDDVFVDVDPQFGIAGGSSWREALRAASNRCEAVLILLSNNWLASKPCWSEFVLAEKHGKPIIPIKIDHHLPDPYDLPVELTNYQVIDKVNISEAEFATRLQYALEQAGAGPENFPLPPGRPPYPGLKALTEEDAALFFGRDAEVLSALDTLREVRETGRKRFFVILGASGSGKSSLLRAGLWPRINRSDRQFLALPTLRPGNAPLTGPQGLWQILAASLTDPRRAQHLPPSMPRTAAALKLSSESHPDTVSNVVRALQQAALTSFADPHARAPSVVLSIDQGEELLSADDRAEADHFLRLINKLIADVPEVIVIVAIRSDEYPQLQNDERFPQDELHPFNLSAMGPAGLARVISGPANRVGLDIDPQLHSLLTTEATGADALPLLAFTLERLYTERLEPERITLADYNRLGGAAGAIAAAADAVRQRAVLAGVPQEHYDALLRRVFLPHLARVNEAGEFARRIAKRSDLDAASQPLVDLLIEQRLLVMDQVGDAPTLEVAHEAILREWPLLAGWLNAEKGFLEWREEIARTRKLADAGQGDLLTGRGLAVAQSFIETREADIAEVDRAFIRASIDAEQAQKRAEEERQELVRQAELTAAQAREEAAQTEAEAQKRIAQQAKRATRRLSLLAVLMAMFAVGAAGAGYWAYMSQQDAVFAQKESESRRLASLASDLRDQGGDDKAMALSWLALPHDEAMSSTPITDEAASELYHQSYLPIFEIEEYADTIFPQQGPYVVSLLAGDRAIVWHSETLEIIAEFDGLMGIEQYYRRMEPVSFTSDGETLHIFQNGELQIFNIPERRVTRTLALPLYNPNRREGIDPPMVYAASDSGRLLFVGTDDGEFGAEGVEYQAYLYDVASSRRLADLSVGAGTLFPPEIEEWGVGGRLEGFDGAFFSPDESLVATAYYEWKNGLLFLWDVETGAMRDVIAGSGSFQSVEYSPDNRFVLARSAIESITDLNADPADYESRTAYLGNQLHDGLDRKSFSLVGPEQPYTADTPGVFHSDEWDNVVRLWEDEPSPHPDTFPAAWAVDTRGIAEQLGILDTTEAFLPLMYASIDSGHVLVSGDGPGECGRVYNIRTDQFLGTLTTGSSECSPHALSPDGRLAFVNSCEVDEFGFQANENCKNAVHVFELTPTTPVQRDSPWTPVDLVTLAEDRAILVNVGGESFHRLNMAGELIETAGFDSQIAAIAVHTETQTAVIGDWRGGVWRYDLSDVSAEPVELGRHASAVSAVALCEDGRLFASGAHDGTIRFGTLGGVESTEASDRHRSSVSGLTYSPATGHWVSSSFDGTVKAWARGTPAYEDTAHGAAVHRVAHQTTGEQVVSASEDGTLRLWAVSLPEDALTLTGHEAAVTDVQWSSDDTQFLSLSDDRTAKVWRANGRLDFTLSGHIDGLSKALFTNDGKLIITADRSGQIRIWDRPSGALLSVRQTDGTTVRGLAHLDGGKSLLAVTASGNTFRWRLAPGGLKERIASVAQTVSGLRPLTARECAQYYLSDLPGANRVCMSEEMSETIEAAEL